MSESTVNIQKRQRPGPIVIDVEQLQRDINARVAAETAALEAFEIELSQKPWFPKSNEFMERYSDKYDELFQIAEDTRKSVYGINPSEVAELCDGVIQLCGISGLNYMFLDVPEGSIPNYTRRIQVLPDEEFISSIKDGYEDAFGINVHKFPIRDSELQDIRPTLDAVQQIFKTIQDEAGDNTKIGKTVIHCYAGHNRSASVVAVAIMTLTGCNLREAVRQIVEVRPIVLYNYSFLRQLVMWATDRGMF
jgi:protein-tyrosine phosphatase